MWILNFNLFVLLKIIRSLFCTDVYVDCDEISSIKKIEIYIA